MDRETEQQKVCIIHPNKSSYSETFIRAHVERLPAQVSLLYGGAFPHYLDDDKPLLSEYGPSRLIRAASRRIFNLPAIHFQKSALKRFLLKEKVDAVLAEVGPVGVEVMDVCLETDVPLLQYLRGADVYSSSIIGRFGYRYPTLFEKTRAIFVVSRHMEHHLHSKYGVPKEKVYYNPSGVDIDLFQGADPASAPPLFVAVGRFVDKKAPHLTLIAFRKVIEIVPKARLIMIGDGPLLEACQLLARALGIGQSVEFLGVRSHVDVASTLQKARAMVQHSTTPSYGDTEGTPNSLKEAGASGLPVVATRHGGIPEIVLHGQTGFLVDEGDLEAMAEYMIQLAEDAGLAAGMGNEAREYVRANFSMDKHIEKLWRVIEMTIGDDGRGR